MGYDKERAEFLQDFGREFPNAPHNVALALLRAGTAEQRYNEITSSIDVGARELERLERASERRTERVRKLCERIGGKLIENGDPRGFAYLIECPSGRAYDWGQRGLGIPGRGLPARCFR
jgi:hypothetical protein